MGGSAPPPTAQITPKPTGPAIPPSALQFLAALQQQMQSSRGGGGDMMSLLRLFGGGG